MARRSGHVWAPGVGWVSKRETEERDYSDYEDGFWVFLIWVGRWYPDKFADIFREDDADYATLEIIQRVMLRANARYTDVAITGTRSLTKTFTELLGEGINGIVWPGTSTLYVGPSLKQLADIGSKTWAQVSHEYKALTDHWRVGAESKDDFRIKTDYGSSFYIGAKRGDNLHAAIAEEFAQEENPPFDFNEYTTVVLPAVRLRHNVKGLPDPNFVAFKNHSITSAGRKQNHAYSVRCETMKAMQNGESAFAIDIPWQVIVLQQMRPYSWAMNLKKKLSPEKWMREMESLYTGADEFPILADDTLSDSQTMLLMERQHCCKYPGCRVNPQDVSYVVCYDVSYENAKKNAKCAIGVWKLTRQEDFFRRDRYLKQLVWMDDWPPPDNAQMQARKVKEVWSRFTHPEGNATYIAIDGWQYGKSVIECLMMDLGDGLPPLCVRNHADYVEAELPNALPIIYPIKAGGVGVTDPDAEMIRYAQTQFDNHNVQILTSNIREGVDGYKRAHRIQNDAYDYRIARPYIKTKELVGQIQNLRAVPGGTGVKEQRISKAIQRDSWSAIKYGLRMCEILEREELISSIRGKGEWENLFNAFESGERTSALRPVVRSRTVTNRQRGRLF